MTSPRVLFYVQHLLGIGHIARASLVASALVEDGFEVTMITGGLPVPGFPGPGIRHVRLTPEVTSRSGFSGLQDAEGQVLDERGEQARTNMLLTVLAETKPDIVITEAFPFGRRQMRFELLPFLDAIKAMRPKPLLFASIRDILQVNKKPGRDRETVDLVKEHFHRVLVHGDKSLTRIEDTFPLAAEIADKILYTGLVAPSAPVPSPERYQVVVSAGGGAVGHALLNAAVAARGLMAAPGRWCVITGPNLDQASFDALSARSDAGMDVFRFRSDFRQLLGSADLSISQAGYNTVCDTLQAGCSMLLVPFAAGGETEQTARAEKLTALGLAEMIEETEITAEAVAEKISTALSRRKSSSLGLQMDGAAETARLLRTALDQAK